MAGPEVGGPALADKLRPPLQMPAMRTSPLPGPGRDRGLPLLLWLLVVATLLMLAGKSRRPARPGASLWERAGGPSVRERAGEGLSYRLATASRRVTGQLFSIKLGMMARLATILLLVGLWVSCGGGGGGGPAPRPQTGTPAGTYTVTVTATAGAVTHTTGLTLTVR
jgi:hypothetical protein